jgi:LysR family transcriptional regulator, regulator of abg operon
MLGTDSQGAIVLRLTQIRDFLAVVECGGIRAAARMLGVAQPTITKSVRGLEEELHVQLVGRNVRGVALTPAGRAFFARARVVQSELRKAEEEAAQFSGSDAGAVAFGVGPVAIALIVPEALTRFRKQFPLARVRIVEGLAHLLLPAVRDESLDFVMGIRPNTELDPTIRFRPLYRSQVVICARKGHPLGHARSLAELVTADWLTSSTMGLPGGPVERLFHAVGMPPPRPMVQCESYSSVVTLLAKTDMLGVIQRQRLQDPFARDYLQEIPIAGPMPTLTAGIFTRADAPLTRVAAAMARAATAVARRLARPG